MLENLITRFGAEEAGAEGVAALGFDAKAFIIQLITFLLVLYILKRYVFGPVVKMLEKRRATIEKGVSLTNELTAQREKLEKEAQKVMAQARKDASDIIAKTNEQSSQMLKEAEAETKEKVDRLLKEAKVKIADETAKARRNLEKDLVQLVVDATEVVADEKLDAHKDAGLISKALKESA